MKKYRFDEHGVGYKVGKTLQPWRPQNSTIISWVKEKSRVLDVGCGDGVVGERLIKEKNCEVYGLDLDEAAIAESKRKGLKAKVWDADDGLPFKTKSFDYAISNGLLEFVNKPDFLIAEILRVGKVAIVEFPNFGFWFYRLEMLFGRFPKLSLYGHEWWNTRQTKFLSLNDFLSLPSMKNVRINRIVCMDWKNREVSFMAKFWPNFFGRSCIVKI